MLENTELEIQISFQNGEMRFRKILFDFSRVLSNSTVIAFEAIRICNFRVPRTVLEPFECEEISIKAGKAIIRISARKQIEHRAELDDRGRQSRTRLSSSRTSSSVSIMSGFAVLIDSSQTTAINSKIIRTRRHLPRGRVRGSRTQLMIIRKFLFGPNKFESSSSK